LTAKYKTGTWPSTVKLGSVVVAARRSFACTGAIPAGSAAGPLGPHIIQATGETSLVVPEATFTLT
jgi:hypothetical protein